MAFLLAFSSFSLRLFYSSRIRFTEFRHIVDAFGPAPALVHNFFRSTHRPAGAALFSAELRSLAK